jgi:hypothetical protein
LARKIVVIMIFLLSITIPTVMANPIAHDDSPIPPPLGSYLLWVMIYIVPIVLLVAFIILMAYFANKKFSKRKSIGLTSEYLFMVLFRL